MPATSIDHAFTARSLTGRASDPTYAGALSFMRRKYTKNVKGADAVVWGIPFDAAVTNRPGARFGPQAIRRASAIFDNDPQYPFHRDLFEQMAVVDYGDCLLDTGNHQKTPGIIEREAAKLLEVGRLPAVARRRPFRHLAAAQGACRDARAAGAGAVRRAPGHLGRRRQAHRPRLLRRRAPCSEGIIDPDRSIQIGIRTHAPDDCGIKILLRLRGRGDARLRHRLCDRRAHRRQEDLPHLRHRLPRPGLSRRAPARRWPAARRRRRSCRCCASSARSTSSAPTSSRLRRPTTMPISRRSPARRSPCSISACWPSARRATAESTEQPATD